MQVLRLQMPLHDTVLQRLTFHMFIRNVKKISYNLVHYQNNIGLYNGAAVVWWIRKIHLATSKNWQPQAMKFPQVFMIYPPGKK